MILEKKLSDVRIKKLQIDMARQLKDREVRNRSDFQKMNGARYTNGEFDTAFQNLILLNLITCNNNGIIEYCSQREIDNYIREVEAESHSDSPHDSDDSESDNRGSDYSSHDDGGYDSGSSDSGGSDSDGGGD